MRTAATHTSRRDRQHKRKEDPHCWKRYTCISARTAAANAPSYRSFQVALGLCSAPTSVSDRSSDEDSAVRGASDKVNEDVRVSDKKNADSSYHWSDLHQESATRKEMHRQDTLSVDRSDPIVLLCLQPSHRSNPIIEHVVDIEIPMHSPVTVAVAVAVTVSAGVAALALQAAVWERIHSHSHSRSWNVSHSHKWCLSCACGVLWEYELTRR